MIEQAPIYFSPWLKDVIWGGERICAYKGIPQPAPNIGESWEISPVPGHISVVASGPYAGQTLDQLCAQFGSELLGTEVYNRYYGKFPLLVKFIDANDDLSVQVHPDDTMAQKRHGTLGKTEMWYIVAAAPGAKIYAGLNTPMSIDSYVECVAAGKFAEKLAVHDSQPGDVFFLPAGRVHAIGAGNLLAEIQEASDITYRIYDYNRVDSAGNPRELHTELAKEAIDFTFCKNYKNPRPHEHLKDQEIIRCEHFRSRRILLSESHELALSPESFTIVICIDGKAELACQEGGLTLAAGHTALVPAVVSKLMLKGEATLLLTRV